MIRQEDALVLPPGEAKAGRPSWAATVETRVFLCGRTRVAVDLEGIRLKCLSTEQLPCKAGDKVALSLHFERLAMVREE